MTTQQEHQLKRGLKNRHIQLIALGGRGRHRTVFRYRADDPYGRPLGPAGLRHRRSDRLLHHATTWRDGGRGAGGGVVQPFRQPLLGPFAGFMSGWNYWVLYVLVSMAELTAVGIYIQYWWPEVPAWLSAAIFFVAINAINLTNVKVYGELEFWFSIVKVAAIISMIAFGSYLLFSGHGGPAATVANLWQDGGFFPNGITGLVMAMAVIMFSFGGLELVGITAAEADEPHKTIPKATSQVIYRILLFYVGSLAVLLSLYPWRNVVEGGSPFVLIFHAIDSNIVANALNLVVLTAALSVYNSCVYCNSRMLFGLAQQGNAPRALLRVNRRGSR